MRTSILFIVFFISLACSVKLIYEGSEKLVDLVGEPYLGETTSIEASGVFAVGDKYYVVSDNIWGKIIEVDTQDASGSSYISLEDTTETENFEGITFDNTTNKFFVVTEDTSNPLGVRKSTILQFDGDTFELLSNDKVDFEFDQTNKGLEGLVLFI